MMELLPKNLFFSAKKRGKQRRFQRCRQSHIKLPSAATFLLAYSRKYCIKDVGFVQSMEGISTIADAQPLLHQNLNVLAFAIDVYQLGIT